MLMGICFCERERGVNLKNSFIFFGGKGGKRKSNRYPPSMVFGANGRSRGTFPVNFSADFWVAYFSPESFLMLTKGEYPSWEFPQTMPPIWGTFPCHQK